MKKLILLFITMVLAFAIANGTTEVNNKGSSSFLNNSNIMLIPGQIELIIAGTPELWVQQNSSVGLLVLDRSCAMMSDSQNLMLECARKLSTQSSLTAVNSTFELPYRQTLETSVEVQKIPNMAIILNSSNVLVFQTGTQWRQKSEMNTMNSTAAAIMSSRGATMQKIWPTESSNLMADTKFAEISNGANGCKVSIVDFYNLFSGDNSTRMQA